MNALCEGGKIEVFPLQIQVQAVNELRKRIAEMPAVFVVNEVVAVQVGKFPRAGPGIFGLERVGVNFRLVLEDPLHFPEVIGTDRITGLGFGQGAVRQAEAAQNGFAVGNREHFVFHAGDVSPTTS